MVKAQSFLLFSLTLFAFAYLGRSDESETEVTTSPKSFSAKQRTPKTSKPSTASIATHPPWSSRSTTESSLSKSTPSRATHPPWPTRSSTGYDPYADFYSSRATHAPYPPIKRATHPPYPPPKKGSEASSSSSSSNGGKKQLLKIDANNLRNWIKEAFAYIAAPLFMPSAITKAIKAPPGLSSPSRSLWSKMIASFRSAILKKGDGEGEMSSGDEDRADLLKENVANFYRKMAEKMASSSWAQILIGKKAHKRNSRSTGYFIRTFDDKMKIKY